MHKHASFAIMAAAVLLPAIVTVNLYTVSRANAQGNENVPSAEGGQEHNVPSAEGGQEHNVTNAAGGEEHNVTNAAGGQEELAVESCVQVDNHTTC